MDFKCIVSLVYYSLPSVHSIHSQFFPVTQTYVVEQYNSDFSKFVIFHV